MQSFDITSSFGFLIKSILCLNSSSLAIINSGIGYEADSMSERFFLVSPYIEKDVHTK